MLWQEEQRPIQPFFQWPAIDPGEEGALLKQYFKAYTEATQIKQHGLTWELIEDAIVRTTGQTYDWAICSRDLHNLYRETEYFRFSVAKCSDGHFDLYYSEVGSPEWQEFRLSELDALRLTHSHLIRVRKNQIDSIDFPVPVEEALRLGSISQPE